MPNTSDRIIISGAGDSEVRIFDCAKEAPLTNMYVCHEDQVRRLAIFKNNPNEFLTCSQDGTVRHFDLREPHICSNHSVRSFMTAQRVPTRQIPRPHGPGVSRGCPKPLVDYRKYKLDLNTISINQLNPHYFAVAGQNEYIYLHDRRMPSRTDAPTVECVKKFTSTSDIFRRKGKHVTAVRFSDYNGYELLGSWSSDGVYLFNINDSPLEPLSRNSTFESLTEPRNLRSRIMLRTSRQFMDEYERRRRIRSTEWSSLLNAFKTKPYTETIKASKKLLHHAVRDHLQLSNCTSEKVPYKDKLIEECKLVEVSALMISALTRIRKLIDSSPDHVIRDDVSTVSFTNRTLEDFTNRDFLLAKEELAQAKRIASHTWKGQFGLAIGYFYAGCLLLSFQNCPHRRLFLHQARLIHQRACRTFSALGLSDYASRKDLAFTMVREIECSSWLNSFRHEILEMCRTAGSLTSMSDPVEIHWEYLRYMVIDADIDLSVYKKDDCEDDTRMIVDDDDDDDDAHNTTDEDDSDDDASSDDDQNDDETINIYSDYDLTDDDILEADSSEFAIHRLAIHGFILNHFFPDDLDLGAGNTDKNIYPEADIVPHRKKFTGHRNIETVKEVDFFGQSDEYIVSGSDDGLLFIWDKKTAKIVQVLKADDEVVNVAKAHPYLPVLAVSGIDTTAKIVTPKAKPFLTSRVTEPKRASSYSPSSRLYDLEYIISKNQKIRGINGQNDIEYLSNIYKAQDIVAAIGLKLEESSYHDYDNIE
ncbi:Putative Wd and tetratricopeptide repeat protein [Rhizopus microsporus]|nr:Putative Wd and tetratricopeptide repeat protein [Rhizopus microsporus]